MLPILENMAQEPRPATRTTVGNISVAYLLTSHLLHKL